MYSRLFKYSFLLFVFSCATEAWSGDRCNPVVEPAKTETSIARLLTGLAEKHNFSLSFPKSLDQPIQVSDSMALEQLIKMLTRGMNTVLRHEKIEGCAGLRLSEITVLPVGDEKEFISVEQKTRAQPPEYIYVDNMEQYVTEVLMRERKANVRQMTPEQATEFRLVRKRLRKELKDEIRQSKKKNRKKGRREKTKKNTGKDGADV